MSQVFSPGSCPAAWFGAVVVLMTGTLFTPDARGNLDEQPPPGAGPAIRVARGEAG